MDAVTYPSPRTVEFVDRHMIAHRVSTGTPSPRPVQFGIQYTPTVIVLDGRAKEHRRNVGFLPPEEFVPFLMLGIAKALINDQRFGQALAMLDWLLMEYGRSKWAPEARDVRRECVGKGGGR